MVAFLQENNETHFHDTETGVELEVTDRQSLVEWIANNYKNFGATLEFITNRQAGCVGSSLPPLKYQLVETGTSTRPHQRREGLRGTQPAFHTVTECRPPLQFGCTSSVVPVCL